VPDYLETVKTFLEKADQETPSPNSTAKLRPDLARIASQIPANSRVLDLGCGAGELLSYLLNEQGCTGTGVERDPEMILAAIAAGVPVMELNIDNQLDQFADNSFDFVVLSLTLQAVKFPADVLRQMSRIGERLIVSMPNFAYWPHRLSLLRGVMPQSSDLPFEWFDTPNIHYTTLNSLEALFDSLGLITVNRLALSASGQLIDWAVNLRASSAIYQLRR